MGKKKTQEVIVREHLEKRGSITSWQAFELYRMTRLSAVIFNLRHKQELPITTDMETTKDGKSYAVYRKAW